MSRLSSARSSNAQIGRERERERKPHLVRSVVIPELVQVLLKRFLFELRLAQIDHLDRPSMVGRPWRTDLLDALAVVDFARAEDDGRVPDAVDLDPGEGHRERPGEAVAQICAEEEQAGASQNKAKSLA